MQNTDMVAAIKTGLGAHGAWKLKLRTAISTGRSEHTPHTVSCDDKCEFGKWLYGPTIGVEIRRALPYQVVRRLHAEFHTCAGRVLTLAVANRKPDAMALLEGEYTERSDKLVRALTKWRNEISYYGTATGDVQRSA